MIHLRYRLLPYIYSLAGKVHTDNYTITRALAFDFASDTQIADLKDEFMFGPAFLVAPVTTPMYYSVDSQPLENVAKTRQVYLPDGANWIDFWTGKKYKGGQRVTMEATIRPYSFAGSSGGHRSNGAGCAIYIGKERCSLGNTDLSGSGFFVYGV